MTVPPEPEIRRAEDLEDAVRKHVPDDVRVTVDRLMTGTTVSADVSNGHDHIRVSWREYNRVGWPAVMRAVNGVIDTDPNR